MPAMLEITGVYQGERFRFANADGDTVIADVFCNSEINSIVAVKGQADQDELQIDQTYRFYGHWGSYKNKRTGITEKQFAFQSFVRQQPASREGIISYLKEHGEGNGLGHARAVKLWEQYGSDAVQVMREQPLRAAEFLREHRLKLTDEQANAVAESLVEAQAIEGCTLDIIDLLKGQGFPKSTSRLVIKAYGNRAGQLIRRDPYKLMNFRGCGFKRCDSLYLGLKLPPARLKRQALCAWYSVASNTEGHTWFPADLAVRYVNENIVQRDPETGKSLANPPLALTLALRAKALAEVRTDGAIGPIIAGGRIRWLAEYQKAQHEKELAELVAAAMKEPCIWPDAATVEGISEHQREELVRAIVAAIGILGGGPGTGKTFTVAWLVKALIAIVGLDNIMIGAPTGKAAVRVTENLVKYGVPLRARTWHSHLATLERLGPDAKFPAKILIGDETSMNDTDLMARVFRRRAVGTHVLLVGDVNQLPPVGHGAPLRDLILAGLPYGELREIKRNSGGIVETCAAIRDNLSWSAGDNLHVIESGVPADQIQQMLVAIKRARGDKIWDTQVVCAVNKRSPLARAELNKILQTELNCNPGVPNSPFRAGDKIVNTKNGYFPSVEYDPTDPEASTNERGEVYVANGELAEVIEVDEKLVIAKLDSPPRTIKIPRGKQAAETDGAGDPIDGEDNAPTTGCSWDLGYALSVHKSQGSEWPTVIVMLDDSAGAKMVCDRAWLYTAISRAKDRCILIGRKSTAERFCRFNKMHHRKTLLKERILLEQANRELGDL